LLHDAHAVLPMNDIIRNRVHCNSGAVPTGEAPPDRPFGSRASPEGPLALRPHLSMGLPLVAVTQVPISFHSPRANSAQEGAIGVI